MQGYAQEAGRDPGSLTGAAYLTLSINDDGAAADDRLNYYLEQYYLQPAEVIRRRQGCYTGPQAGAIDWLRGFVVGGATHLALRLIGNHERNIEIAAQIRSELHAD